MSTPQTVVEIDKTTAVNPATGEIIGYSQINTPEEGRQAIVRAREAQKAWAALPVEERVRYMRRIRDYMVDHADEISAVISKDVGKARVEGLATEVLPSVMGIDYYCSNAKRFLKPKRLGGGALLFLNKTSKLYRVPFGVVGIISPWNYPLGIPMHEIVPALLAGNTVVFKTAVETQMVGRKIEEIIAAAELPEDVFIHVNISGSMVSQIMLDPAHHVDKLFFTGSVPVGKTLMAKAAESLTPVSLELGGNDAMLVCEDANLERAVNGAIWAGLQNSGQSCGGVERIYVHEAIYEPFVQKLKERVDGLRQAPDSDYNIDVGAICTSKQVQTIKKQVDDALAQGATLYAQAKVDEAHAKANFFPATVLTDVNHDMEVMREETFGPILGVMKVSDMDEAVKLANDSQLGLTGSVWSNNSRRAVELGRRVEAGAITINDHLLSHGLAQTPWGGFKESGIGRSHGQLGFDEMTEPQVVINELLYFSKRNVFWQPYSQSVYEGLRGTLNLFYGGNQWKRRLVGLWQFTILSLRMFFGNK
ncbi:MAG: aldehyde dehydrogenase family protein [Candidatus Competibacteraceae bacterium]|jgi:succinate-semialdehyde dehydrogenase/glutarate-semialdehyde dehydrogenase|nr:aldehyde dehydrogenase family protein [Candidatus Competibacteraceae bacterium]